MILADICSYGFGRATRRTSGRLTRMNHLLGYEKRFLARIYMEGLTEHTRNLSPRRGPLDGRVANSRSKRNREGPGPRRSLRKAKGDEGARP